MTEFPFANRPSAEDIQGLIQQQQEALIAGRFLPHLQMQTPGMQAEAQAARIEPVYEFRVWEKPKPNTLYGIGVDPSEGLSYGDDSTVQVGNCTTGVQVAEIQGKIHPFDLAELLVQVGTWYNTALVGIENNRDGGCNAKLMEMGYENIYFLAEDRGGGYQQQLPKIGINMNVRRRAELIAQFRRWLEEERIHIRSEELLSQMEIFALHNGKFQAPKGGHDDLVMSMLICIEMMKQQLEIQEVKEQGVLPWVDGAEDRDIFDGVVEEEGKVDRMLKHAIRKAQITQVDEEHHFMDNMV